MEIGADDGRRELDGTPDTRFVVDLPLANRDVSLGRCLWVIMPETAPYAREVCDFARRQGLEKNAIKHTNLTGGGPAHCGGELWFVGESTIVVNGLSGRYGPQSPEELRDAALALQSCGYKVGYLPWDEELLEFSGAPVGKHDVKWL